MKSRRIKAHKCFLAGSQDKEAEILSSAVKGGERMVEIVFGDSAHGSLKQAQRFGEGAYRSGAIGVIISHADGSEPTEEEICAAQREAEKQMRAEWEAATPMGGNPANVYGFSYALSMGDISEDVPGEKRQKVLEWLYSVHSYLDNVSAFVEKMMHRSEAALRDICSRIAAGENVRIWYSNQPDELCGLHWFMAQISHLKLQTGQILLVALPDYECREDGTVVTRSGWDSVMPGEWHRYTALRSAASSAFCTGCASLWKRLQQENAPLRAVLNGRLVSMPETLYDAFIIREIEAEESEFNEVTVIAKVLGKYELGISDAWIAQRMEAMIAEGSLVPITEPAPDSPIYHRRLQKVSSPLAPVGQCRSSLFNRR